MDSALLRDQWENNISVQLARLSLRLLKSFLWCMPPAHWIILVLFPRLLVPSAFFSVDFFWMPKSALLNFFFQDWSSLWLKRKWKISKKGELVRYLLVWVEEATVGRLEVAVLWSEGIGSICASSSLMRLHGVTVTTSKCVNSVWALEELSLAWVRLHILPAALGPSARHKLEVFVKALWFAASDGGVVDSFSLGDVLGWDNITSVNGRELVHLVLSH